MGSGGSSSSPSCPPKLILRSSSRRRSAGGHGCDTLLSSSRCPQALTAGGTLRASPSGAPFAGRARVRGRKVPPPTTRTRRAEQSRRRCPSISAARRTVFGNYYAKMLYRFMYKSFPVATRSVKSIYVCRVLSRLYISVSICF